MEAKVAWAEPYTVPANQHAATGARTGGVSFDLAVQLKDEQPLARILDTTFKINKRSIYSSCRPL